MSKLGVFDLAVRYGKLTAVSELSFTVAEGERVFVSGPNGAGKSSLLSAIAGTVRAAHGRIEMDGEILSGLGPESVARRGLSMVPEGRRIFAGLTVRENLMVGTGLRRDRGAVADDLETVFTAFPILRDRAAAPAGALSGGQQQMLAIARALMTNPKVMLVDEPSLGLAPKVVDEVYDRLCELQALRGLTLVIVEQSSSRASRVGGRMLLMRGGRIVADGDAAAFAADNLLTEAYFGDAA
ncbi:ABC transporter ATP-binding protein [Albidovulum sp.]|uniref:ABC transporter ATP-binding protein n=1 Tax=Albidovulum sp. TaxID=1872424 RepID=UPI0039B9A3AF